MDVKLTYLAPLLAAGAAPVMIGAAPIASAESTTQQSCNETVSGSVCESPGNVELNDTPGPTEFPTIWRRRLADRRLRRIQ